MGNFLLVAGTHADVWFEAGLAVARQLGFPEPSFCAIERGRLARFPRRNGTGAAFYSDPGTDSWILTLGTWFHRDEYDANRLLTRCLAVGPASVGRELEGFFVVVLGDGSKGKFSAITDLTGSCHCFCRFGEGVMALSGSSLLLAGLAPSELDPVACQEFLSTGIIYEDRTLFREVRKLGPASAFRFSDGRIRAEERYWRIADLEPDALDRHQAARALRDKLTRAARRVGARFTRPVCDLTGGYDSRATVSAFLEAGVPFATTVSGPSTSRDVVVAGELARKLGVLNLHIDLQPPSSFEEVKPALPLTDGECELVQYARTMEVHRRLSEQFDISINGSYGEVARGYWWELLFPWAGAPRPLDVRRLARARFAAEPFDASLFPPELRLDMAEHLTGVIERANVGMSRLPNTLQMDNAYLSLRMQRWQGRIASSTNRIWPCLSPFMFRSVLETVLQARSAFRQRSLLIRAMLAATDPMLANHPLEHGYPAVPATLANLHRFLPLLGYYGGRILSRLPLAREASSGTNQDTRLFWNDAVVREILDPRTMCLSRVTAAERLDDFLARSRLPGFAFFEQLKRVLTLEYTLRRLEAARPGSMTLVGKVQ